MRIRWSSVLIAILALVALAYNRQIGEAMGELRLGDMWEEFCWEIWRTPPLGRFGMVAMVLLLLYITVYMLILNRGK